MTTPTDISNNQTESQSEPSRNEPLPKSPQDSGPSSSPTQSPASSLTVIDHINSIIDSASTNNSPVNLSNLHLTQADLKHSKLFNAPWITHLDLSSNNLSKISSSIGNLTKLVVLKLSNNKLISLPKSLGDLKELEQLWANNNCLTKINAHIGTLSKLHGTKEGFSAFRVDGNENIPLIPPEIMIQPPLDILSWLASEAQVPVEIINSNSHEQNETTVESTDADAVTDPSPSNPDSDQSPVKDISSINDPTDQQVEDPSVPSEDLNTDFFITENTNAGDQERSTSSPERTNISLPNTTTAPKSLVEAQNQLLQHLSSTVNAFGNILLSIKSLSPSDSNTVSQCISTMNSLSSTLSSFSTNNNIAVTVPVPAHIMPGHVPHRSTDSENNYDDPDTSHSDLHSQNQARNLNNLNKVTDHKSHLELLKAQNISVYDRIPVKIVQLTIPESKVRKTSEYLTSVLKVPSITKIHASERFSLQFRLPDYLCDTALSHLREDIGVGDTFGFIDVFPLVGSWPIPKTALTFALSPNSPRDHSHNSTHSSHTKNGDRTRTGSSSGPNEKQTGTPGDSASSSTGSIGTGSTSKSKSKNSKSKKSKTTNFESRSPDLQDLQKLEIAQMHKRRLTNTSNVGPNSPNVSSSKTIRRNSEIVRPDFRRRNRGKK